jgi:hypothetical protein
MTQPQYINCNFHFYGDGNATLSNGVAIAMPGVMVVSANLQITFAQRGYWLVVDASMGDVLLQLPSLLDALHDRMPIYVKHEFGDGQVGVLPGVGDSISGKAAISIPLGGWRQLIACAERRRWIEICGGCNEVVVPVGATTSVLTGGATTARTSGGKRGGRVRGGAKPGVVVGGEV